MVCGDSSTPAVARAARRPTSNRDRGRRGHGRLRSGVADAGDLAERRDEAGPVLALRGEHLPAGLGDPVVAAPPLAGLLDPAAADPAPRFEAIERGVERGQREASACRRTAARSAGRFRSRGGRRPPPAPGSAAPRCRASPRRMPVGRPCPPPCITTLYIITWKLGRRQARAGWLGGRKKSERAGPARPAPAL